MKEVGSGEVLIEDDYKCHIKSIHFVKLSLDNSIDIVLEDVRYISKLKRNLISLLTIDFIGFTIKIKDTIMKVLKRSLVGSREVRANDLYLLQGW